MVLEESKEIDTSQQINILQLYEMAGVASAISKFWKKFGLGTSQLLTHNKSHDTIVQYQKQAVEFPKFLDVVKSGLKQCRDEKVDIVWIHSAEIVVPIFKLLTRKKIVLSYHGSDLNKPGRSKNLFRIICRSMADLIIYNQKRHLEKIITINKVRKEYLTDVIDTSLFYPRKPSKKQGGSVAFISDNLDRGKTLNLLKEFKDLTIIDRNDGIIPFEKMPEVLCQYDTLIDIKVTHYGLLLSALSNIALQSLLCGLKVHTFEGKVIDKFPDEYLPEKVLEKTHQYFSEILKR